MIDLYKALLKAQSEMPPVKETSTNPHFKSRYADLETVIDTVRPVLNKHGLLFVQGGAHQHGGPWLITQLIHADSGQEINFGFPIVSKDADNPQAMGAAITYAKRYGLLAILGIATEDDDGNTASAPPQPRQQQSPAAYGNQPNTIVSGNQQRPTANNSGDPMTDRQLKMIWFKAGEQGIDSAQIHAFIKHAYGADTMDTLTKQNATALIDLLVNNPQRVFNATVTVPANDDPYP